MNPDWQSSTDWEIDELNRQQRDCQVRGVTGLA